MSCCFMTWNTSTKTMAKIIKVNDDSWYSIWKFEDMSSYSSSVQEGYVEIVDTYTGGTGEGWGTVYQVYDSANDGQFANGFKALNSYRAWLQGIISSDFNSTMKSALTSRNFHFPWSSDDSRMSSGYRFAVEGKLRSAENTVKLAKKHIDSSFFDDEDVEAGNTHWRYESGKQYPDWTLRKCNPVYFENYGDSTGITVTGSCPYVVGYGEYGYGSFNLYSSSVFKYLPTYNYTNLRFTYSSSATKKKYIYCKSSYNEMYRFLGYINPGETKDLNLNPNSQMGLTSGITIEFIFRDAELSNYYYCDAISNMGTAMGSYTDDEIAINSNNTTLSFTKGYTTTNQFLYPQTGSGAYPYSASNIYDATIGDWASGFGYGLVKTYNAASKSAWETIRDSYYGRKPFNLYEQDITIEKEYFLIPAIGNSNANCYGKLFKDYSGNFINIKSFDFSNGRNYISTSYHTYYVFCPCWNFKNKCSTDITVKAFNWTVPKSDTGYAMPAKKEASIVVTNNSTSTQNIYIDDVLIATLAAGESHTETKTPDPGKVVVIRNTSSTNKIRVNGEWKDATAYIRVGSEWKQCIAYVWKDGAWHQTS